MGIDNRNTALPVHLENRLPLSAVIGPVDFMFRLIFETAGSKLTVRQMQTTPAVRNRAMNLTERWIDYLYRTATGTRKYRSSRTPAGLAIFGLLTALFVVLAIMADRMLNLPWPLPDESSRVAAYLLISIGAAIIGWTVFCFRKSGGTPVPVNPPPVLIDSGPYQYARNPMLTGVFLSLFGLGFALQSLSLVLIFTPLYAAAHVWELKHIEEPELTRRFGDEFLAYRERTPMFFPRIRLKK